MAEVIDFRKGQSLAEKYCAIADERTKKKDFAGALSCCKSALQVCSDEEKLMVYKEIFGICIIMNHLETAAQYAILFLHESRRLGKDSDGVYHILATVFGMIGDYEISEYYSKLARKEEAELKKQGKKRGNYSLELDNLLSDEELDEMEDLDLLPHEDDIDDDQDEDMPNAPEDELDVEQIRKLVFGEEKEGYHLVGDKDDYTRERREGLRWFNCRNYEKSIEWYNKIPDDKKTISDYDDLTLAYQYTGREKDAIATCKKCLKVCGENTVTYCNLSAIYEAKHDLSKMFYYYNQAVEVQTDDMQDCLKLYCMAPKCYDSHMVVKCAEKILKDRPNFVSVMFDLAVAYNNIGKYEESHKMFCDCAKLVPNDKILEWYAENSGTRVEDDKTVPCLGRLFHERDFPEENRRKWLKDLDDGVQHHAGSKIGKRVRAEALLGIYSCDHDLAKCALSYIIDNLSKEEAENAINEVLLNMNASVDVKIFAVLMLTYIEKSGRVGIVAEDKYVYMKISKWDFDIDNKKGYIYQVSYAIATMELAVCGIDDSTKSYDIIKKILNNNFDTLRQMKITESELAVISIVMAKYKDVDIMRVLGSLRVDIKRVNDFINLIKTNKT